MQVRTKDELETHQRLDDRCEGGADNYGNGKVNHITAQDEICEPRD